jgi:hypothetical protein
MLIFPLIVKCRDAGGKVAQVHCDDVKRAIENAAHFRNNGYKEVWNEDPDGRLVDERTLST